MEGEEIEVIKQEIKATNEEIMDYAKNCKISEKVRLEDLFKGKKSAALAHIVMYSRNIRSGEFDKKLQGSTSIGVKHRLIFDKGNNSLVFVLMGKQCNTNFMTLLGKDTPGILIDQQVLLAAIRRNIFKDMGDCSNTKIWEPMRITYLVSLLVGDGWHLKRAKISRGKDVVNRFAKNDFNYGIQNAPDEESAFDCSGVKGLKEFQKRKAFIEDEVSDETKDNKTKRLFNMWHWNLVTKYTSFDLKKAIDDEKIHSIALDSMARLKDFCIDMSGTKGFKVRETMIEKIEGVDYIINSQLWMKNKMMPGNIDTMREHYSRKIISVEDFPGHSGKKDLKLFLEVVCGWIVVQAPRKGVTIDSIAMRIGEKLKKNPNAPGIIIDTGRGYPRQLMKELCLLLEDLRETKIEWAKYAGGEADLSNIDFVMVLSNTYLPYNELTADRWIIHVLERLNLVGGCKYDRAITSFDMSGQDETHAKSIADELTKLDDIESRRQGKEKVFSEFIDAYKRDNGGKHPNWEYLNQWRSLLLEEYTSSVKSLRIEHAKRGQDQDADTMSMCILTKNEIEKKVLSTLGKVLDDDREKYKACFGFLSEDIDESHNYNFYSFMQSVGKVKKRVPSYVDRIYRCVNIVEVPSVIPTIVDPVSEDVIISEPEVSYEEKKIVKTKTSKSRESEVSLSDRELIEELGKLNPEYAGSYRRMRRKQLLQQYTKFRPNH